MRDGRANPIREAIASEEYERAMQLWTELTVQVSKEIIDGTCTAATMSEICDLVAWSRNIVACDLPHLQSQLTALWVGSRYVQEPLADSWMQTSG